MKVVPRFHLRSMTRRATNPKEAMTAWESYDSMNVMREVFRDSDLSAPVALSS